MILADTWVVVGAIAGIVAAITGGAAVVATIVYGRKTDADARTAVRYERLREVREMLDDARVAAGNTRFGDCNDICGRVATILPQLPGDYPNVRAFVEVDWTVEGYVGEPGMAERFRAATEEVDQAIRRLGTE